MRNKIPEEDKKKTISVSIHPDLVELIEKYTKENKQNKSKLIEELIKEYFKKQNNEI